MIHVTITVKQISLQHRSRFLKLKKNTNLDEKVNIFIQIASNTKQTELSSFHFILLKELLKTTDLYIHALSMLIKLHFQPCTIIITISKNHVM